ncbi:unnamed protein product [Absidia cylindrospora]
MTQLKFQQAPPLTEKDMMPTLNQVVTINNCYYYLAMIERFWRVMDVITRDQQRLYLARAEFRYEFWVRAFDEKRMPTPPLDIAFMWHTHLLSPLRLYEISLFVFLQQDQYLMHPCLWRTWGKNGPTKDTLAKWERIFGETGEPYELNASNMASGDYCKACIMCKHEIRLPWTTYAGYRYGENTTPFDHPCGINRQINFLDVARMKLEYDLTPKGNKGTLLSPSGIPRQKPNTMVPLIVPLVSIEPQNEMDYSYELQIEDKLKSLGKKYEHDANELLYAIRTCYQGNPSPFSIDLIHAVARQRKFYDAAISMDWSTTNAFSSAIRRYHDFLTLMKKDSSLIAVPTIEIDCAWHTHMLFSGPYRRFTRNKLDRVINHDDTIPEPSLKKFTNDTCRAWTLSPTNYWITKIERPRGSAGPYKVSLAVDDVGFGEDYSPGKVYSNKNDRHHIADLLNGEIVNSKRDPPARVSAHCRDVPKSFFRDDIDAEQMESMQNFIGEGMKKTSYGYIGTASCGTGGKSAIYSSDDRSHRCKVISSFKPRWYQTSEPKQQNKYRDFDGSKSTSDRFHDDRQPPTPSGPRRRRSRDDLTIYYSRTQDGNYINYSRNMYNKEDPETHGRRAGNNAGALILIGGGASAAGASGGCGGGGGGGGC